MLPEIRDYERLRAAFRWQIPARYNIGVDACDKWAAREPDKTALIVRRPEGGFEPVTYGRLREQSNRLANALRALGIARGDRVAIILPQSTETAIAHLAIYKLGGIALPLASLFGVEALSYRLGNAGARAAITNAAGLAKLSQIRERHPRAQARALGRRRRRRRARFRRDAREGFRQFHAGRHFRRRAGAHGLHVRHDRPAEGRAARRTACCSGIYPGVQFPHEFFPKPGDRMWTPADWAWAGGLLNILLPGLAFGVPVVAKKSEKFDPEEAFALMAEAEVRNTFIPPTALRMLRAAGKPKQKLSLRTVGSGGEALGVETYEWGREALGLTINEFYGQTECNLVLSACGAIGISKPGYIGKPVPGHEVAVIRADGSVCTPGELGQIAVKRPDPVMFLEYWKRAGRHARQVHRRLDDDRRPGRSRRRRLCALRRPR